MSEDSKQYSDAGLRFIIAAACLVIVIAGLRAAAEVVLPFLVAVFLAIISVPLIGWLQRFKVPRAIAVFCTVLLAGGIIGVFGLVVSQSVNGFSVAVPHYQDRFQVLLNSVLNLASDLGLPIEEWRSLELLPIGGVFDVLGGALGAVASFASNTFLVLLTVIFVLMEAVGFSAKLRAAFGNDANFRQLGEMTRQVQHYLVIKSAISGLTGVIIGFWATLFGLDFALLWGLIAFILNFIPTLGSIIAAIPAVLLATIQFGFAEAGLIAVGYLAVNLILGNFLEPTLLGRRLGLSTLVVFVSLVFWGWVWGPIGMLFSVPLTMAIKIALENTRDLRWVAVMLDANPSSLPPTTSD